MSFKLLVAACCLLAAVQARPPKVPTTSCSIACVSRTFWTGYQVGKVYTYEFEQKIELTTDLSASQKSRLRLTGLAKVEVHSDCELALTVEVKESQVGDIEDADSLSPREPPSKVLDALRLPLRFSYENGQIKHLCPAEGETRASLNIKRGLLSQLQVSTDQRGQSHQLEERDVLGDCWTEYIPEGPNTLLKTKDLAKCKKLNYQVYPLTGVKSFNDEPQQAITKGNLRCRIEIDAERDIVKETICTEEQLQSTDHGSQDSVEEKVRTSTRLSLKTEASGLVNALHEVSKRSDLRHAHKTSGQCHSSSAWLEEDLFHSANECVERMHDAKTSPEFAAQARKTLEELCEATKAANGVTQETPKKYADLIKYLRGITEQADFNQLYKWVRDGFCAENPLLRALLRSAIPTVGTKQSVTLILDQLSNSNIEGAHRENWLVNGIALMRHPTVDILPELLTYVKKRRDDAMLDVTRDEPLALSAVVHKICQERPDCESEPRVKAVIDYFSESLGLACEKFATDADNAFVALLSVGNMGRVSGGAKALVRCAANPSLSTVYRVFALHSLRRFVELAPEAQDLLVELMLNSELDSEIRIVAYQALSRHSFKMDSRVHQAIRRLLNKDEEDRQVQMFVYTHAKSLKGDAASQIAPVLRDASTASKLEKLSRRQYSNSLNVEYYSKNLGVGAQAEVPIIFSAQSALPRYVGLNLTVNLPTDGQSINLMEIGVRMQGLERLIEELYSRIAKKFGPESQNTETSKSSGQGVHDSELTGEQGSSFEKASNEPRIDLLVRRYGAELSHSDLSGGFLESIPEISNKVDYKTLKNLITSKFSGSDEPMGLSAGTLVESTLSIPTIAGLPILVKKELHYLTNLRIESKTKAQNGADELIETAIDVKPAAAVMMSRTVAVDAIFERAGIQSRTNYMTSTGLRLSMKKNNEGSPDSQFTFKIEPLVKKQNLADAKTEVNFFQHTASKVHIEKPVEPQKEIVKSENCIEGMPKKYFGHKLCYNREYLPSCKKSLRSFCQCPGSYRLFAEKSDNFGAYEMSFILKKQSTTRQLQIILGDQKSKDRLLKFNAQMITTDDKTNYKLELQNPIFPIVLDSNITKESGRYRVYTELQAGSVQYVASGAVQPNSDKGIKLEGEIYPKEKLSQKLRVSLEHSFNGLCPLFLPIATSKLHITMHTGSQLSLEYDLKHDSSKFAWEMNSQYKTSKGDVTSMRYRVQMSNRVESAESSTIFLYDLEVQNPRGNNLAHSLHTKMIRRIDTSIKQTTATIDHKLQYGVEKKRSPMDFEARVTLRETADRELLRITGDGELSYMKNDESAKLKLENVRVQLGEVPDTTDGFGKQKLYALSYDVKYEEAITKYQVELRHLPWKRWTKIQQAFELLTKATMGTTSYTVQLKHSLNGEKYIGRQIAKVQVDNDVLFVLDHKMGKPEGTDSFKHEFDLRTPKGTKVQAKWGIMWPEENTMKSDIIIEVNDKKFLGCKQTVRRIGSSSDHKLNHEMILEMLPSSYNLETSARISRQSAADFADLLNYQVRLITGRYSPIKSLRLLATLLRDLSLEHSTKLVGPTPSQRTVFENAIDWSSESVIWKNLLLVTIESKTILNYGLTINRIREYSDSQSWTRKEGLKLEVKAMDKALTSEVEGGWFKDTRTYKSTLRIASKDTWDWHDIKVEINNKKEQNKWETLLITEGKVSKFPIMLSTNITMGKDAMDYIIISATNPSTKLRINLNKTPSPLQLTANVYLDGDFGLLSVKEIKASTDFNMQDGASFITEAEADGVQVLSAKLKISKKVFLADLKTAHPMLQEAGIKTVLDTESLEEAVKCNTIFRFVGLTTRFQIKKTGTVKLSFNSPVYKFLFGATGNIEFEGFDGLISYKSLQYDVMLKKKPGMEFQFVTSINSPDSSAKQPLLYLTSALNYWPLKAELQLKTKLPSLNYGVRAEIDYTTAFVGYEYKDHIAAVIYEVQDQMGNVKAAKFRVECNFCTLSTESLVAGQANMTWPLKLSEFELGMSAQVNSQMLPGIAVRFVHRPSKKQILATITSNAKTHRLIDCSYTQKEAEDGVRGDALLFSDLRIFMGRMARAKVRASYQYGKDKEITFGVSWANSDEEVLQGQMFWLSTPRSSDSIPVADIDRGLQLKGFGLDAYAVHSTKSDKKCEWQLSIRDPMLKSPVTGRLEVNDGKIKAGKIAAFNRELVLSSSEDGSVQVTLRTNSEETKTLRVKWSGNYESQVDFRGKLEIEVEGETNIFEVKAEPPKIIVNYGRNTAPNVLKIEYEASDITSPRDMTAELKITHETNAEKNSKLTLLPGVQIPLPTTQYAFKINIKARSIIRSLAVNLEAANLGVKSMYYKHDFTAFPQSFSAEGNLIGSEESQKIWEMNIKVDKDVPTLEAQWQISDLFKVSFKAPKFQLKFNTKLDLTIQFPQFMMGQDYSDKQELSIQMALPMLKINEPIKLKISHEKVEGRQLTIKYGQGDDDKIFVWSVAARKFSLWPKFEVDWETGLKSKVARWGVRSIDARLQSSKDSLTDTDEYTLNFKTSIRVNGYDLSTTTIRLDGKRNALPQKGELTMTGHTECAIKFDLSKKDKLAKIKFSLDKLGASRDKYSMKFEVSPLKTNSWCPDFKLEIECPHRHFLVDKEFKETAGESSVTVQLYLNKRMDHGVSVTYKVESSTSEARKYTVEVDLPTRKLRAIWQPEISTKKFGVMTTFDWDASKSTERIIGLDARIDFSSDVLAIIECKAPFLNKRLKIEGRYENKESGFGVLLKYIKGETEALAIKGDYSYQRQAQTNVVRFSLESTGAVESKISMNTQITSEMIENLRRTRFDGALKVKVHSYEKNIKFVYRQLREITVTCEHGASLSLKYSTDQKNLHQLVFFVSNNGKEAARLMLSLSKPMRRITAMLDVGSGSFNHKSDLRGPHYRPESVLMRADLTWENEDARVTVFVGKMTVGQKLISEDASSVPAHLTFLDLGVKKAEDSKRKFRINWRSPSRDKVDEIINKVKRSIKSFGTDATAAVTSTLEYIKIINLRAPPTVNGAWIVEELSSLASNDMDKLLVYFEHAAAKNEFYLRQVLVGVSAVGRMAKICLATVSEAANRMKETMQVKKTVEIITEASKRVWKSATELYDRFLNKIPFEDIMTITSEYTTSVRNLAYNLIDQSVRTVMSYTIGVYALVSETTSSEFFISEYFNGQLALINVAKDNAKQLWSQVRLIVGACAMGTKSLIMDDLLPLAVNHLEDFKIVRDLYDNLMIELRVWYDRDASSEQRTALTRTAKLLNFIFSEDTQNTLEYMTEGWKLIYRGDFVDGIKKLFGGYKYTIWRPVCDAACQRGETFASVEGYFYQPNYSKAWPMITAPIVVLRRIGSKLTRDGFPEASIVSATLGSTVGVWNPVERLLTVRHHTAVLSGDNQLITFDGLALTHERPCNYLVAREFSSGLFSVVQEYRKISSRQVRDRLRVRFGSTRVNINRDGSVQLNDKTERLPMKKMTETGKTIEAAALGDLLTVQFHASLRNTLVIRCSSQADSCVISVHPLYQGSVHGLAGSNDGRKVNDIRQRDASEHVKFWTAGQCVESGSASVSFNSEDSSSVDGTNNCYAWFRKPSSPLAKCFEAIDPEPYLAICQRQERLGRDPCAASRQYADRCAGESIEIQTPSKCIACRLDSDGDISKPGLVRDKETLQKRIQVLFLVENSACGLDSIGTRGSRLQSVARMIDRLRAAEPKVKTIEFGLATFGGSDSPNSPLTKMSLSKEDEQATNRSFGSVEELSDALTRLQLTRSNDDSVDSTDVLQAIAALNENYQWRPLAQKHLIIVACKPCTAKAWNYASLFAKAQQAVKDKIFVHTISKTAIRPEHVFPDIMGYDEESYHLSDWSSAPLDSLRVGTSRRLASTECSAELATESDTSAKGSVWRQEKFVSGGEESTQTMQLLVTKEIQRRLEKPDCRMCNCGGGSIKVLSQPQCRIVKCNN